MRGLTELTREGEVPVWGEMAYIMHVLGGEAIPKTVPATYMSRTCISGVGMQRVRAAYHVQRGGVWRLSQADHQGNDCFDFSRGYKISSMESSRYPTSFYIRFEFVNRLASGIVVFVYTQAAGELIDSLPKQAL